MPNAATRRWCGEDGKAKALPAALNAASRPLSVLGYFDAGALMRLCESARLDAELSRRYLGLAPDIERNNLLLAERLDASSLSTHLIVAALGIDSAIDEFGAVSDQHGDAIAGLHPEPRQHAGHGIHAPVELPVSGAALTPAKQIDDGNLVGQPLYRFVEEKAEISPPLIHAHA